MKVKYRIWEADQGLEDIQAKIYTKASGLPAMADQIRERNIRRDPNYTRYAMTEKGEPLAYVTARNSGSSPGRTYIGYPWKMPDCPTDVQEKMFNELFEYIKKRDETKSIGTTVVVTSDMAQTQLEFFKERGFSEDERVYSYIREFNVQEISAWKMDAENNDLIARLATTEDLNLLMDVFKADPAMSRAFPDDAALKGYLEQRVLPEGHAVLVYSGELVVASGALLRKEPDGLFLTGDEERVIMRYSAVRPGYDSAWKKLLIELSKESISSGWKEIPLRVAFSFVTGVPAAKGLASIIPELNTFEIILVYRET